MEDYFLLAVGAWNLIGSLFLYAMLHPAIADQVLRKWTWTITAPYEVGQYGVLWLWWAATTNTFFAGMNLFALGWVASVQRVVIYGDGFVYGVLLLPAIAALRHPGYGKGHYINVALGGFWLLWAIATLGVMPS